jgi:hypothetical protein
MIAFRAVAKGNKIPVRANCMRNLHIACNADNISNIPLGEIILKFKNGGKFLNSFYNVNMIIVIQ